MAVFSDRVKRQGGSEQTGNREQEKASETTLACVELCLSNTRMTDINHLPSPQNQPKKTQQKYGWGFKNQTTMETILNKS